MAGENINRRLNIYINDREVVNSQRGISREMAKVRNEIRNLNAGAADYSQQLTRLNSTYAQLDVQQQRFRQSATQTRGVLGSLRNALGPVASGMLAAFSIGGAASLFASFVGNAKKVIKEFGQSIADLQALTGATGKDLQYLKDQAIALGKGVEGGAVAVAEAYKLIASAKPELLDNVAALNQVTEAVITLAQASGMKMPEAAIALTDAMNQFGADASQAAMFVDTLANGSKYGSAEINQITESLLKFGAVAKSSKINIQESTAAIEALAEKGLKGADAGTSLRNVMLKLSAPDALPKEAQERMRALGISFDVIKDKSIPFAKRLEALKPLLADSGSLMRVFGIENSVAAMNLISSTDRIEELTEKMHEHGTAMDQAKIRLDSWPGSLEKLGSAWDSFILSLAESGNGLGNTLKGITNEMTSTVEGWRKIFTSSEKLKEENLAATRKEGLDSIIKSYGQTEQINEGQLLMIKRINSAEIADNANKVRALHEQNKKLAENKHWLTGAIMAEDHNLMMENKKIIDHLNKNSTLLIGKNEGIKSLIKSKNPTVTNDPAADGTSAGESEEDKRKREKAIAEAKKRTEEFQRDFENSQKELLATKRSYEDASLELQKEGYQKERDLLNSEYDRKIEDTLSKILAEQKAIDKLNTDLKSPNNSSSDVALIKGQLANKIEIQKAYNDTIISLDETRNLKLATLQEKYLKKEFDDKEAATARELMRLQTRHNNELAAVTTLEEAKEILAGSLTEKELKQVRTLEDAKAEIKKKHQREELDLQKQHLLDMMAQMQSILGADESAGFGYLKPEQRDEMLKYMDELAFKISALNGQNPDEAVSGSEKKALTGIDVLGFYPDQWEQAFQNFDTLGGKIGAIGMVIGGLSKAFGHFFSFLDAGDQRSLQKFQKNNDRKKAALTDQLDKGYITQEVYNARVAKLEQEMEKKKAEMEYRKAKREKIMAALNIISSTAQGVGSAMAASPLTFGMPWAAVIAATGALSLASVLAAPLPSKTGYKSGGFTKRGNSNHEDGPVHKNEYVIPESVLYSSDPIVPNVVNYLESKRQGESPQLSTPGTNTAQGSSGASSGISEQLLQKIAAALDRNSDFLNYLIEEGIDAFVEIDVKTAKKIRTKLKELETIENQAKR